MTESNFTHLALNAVHPGWDHSKMVSHSSLYLSHAPRKPVTISRYEGRFQLRVQSFCAGDRTIRGTLDGAVRFDAPVGWFTPEELDIIAKAACLVAA